MQPQVIKRRRAKKIHPVSLLATTVYLITIFLFALLGLWLWNTVENQSPISHCTTTLPAPYKAVIVTEGAWTICKVIREDSEGVVVE